MIPYQTHFTQFVVKTIHLIETLPDSFRHLITACPRDKNFKHMKRKESIGNDCNGYRAQVDRDGWFLKGQLIFSVIFFLFLLGYVLGFFF